MTIQTFVTQLCEHCGLEADQVEISIVEENDTTIINLALPEEESGLFIGYRGETLLSLQRLIRLVFQEELGDKKYVLNINEYREQRNKKLQELTESVARKVLETGNPYTFNSYFPSYERFLIHSIISTNPEFAGLESVSEGEGKTRLLTIQLKQA